MTWRNRPAPWRWLGLSSCLLVLAWPMSGCGSSDSEGDADFRQKFEKPTGEAKAPPKEKPTPYKNLSPAEKRALKKEKGE